MAKKTESVEPDSKPARSEFQVKLRHHLAAAYPVLSIETHEEPRVVEEIHTVVQDMNQKVGDADGYHFGWWNCVSGLVLMRGKDPEAIEETEDLLVALSHLSAKMQKGQGLNKTYTPYVVILKDVAPHWENNPQVQRQFRNMVGSMKSGRQTLVFVGPAMTLPSTLLTEVQSLPFALPSRDNLGELFRHAFKPVTAKFAHIAVSDALVESVQEAAAGMTAKEADNAFALAIIANNKKPGEMDMFNIPTSVFEEKVAVMKNSFLEYMPTKFGFESVGGLEALKAWSMQRRIGFDAEARALHIPYPKGVLLGGPRGVGKSVTAMAIAREFGFPLFKLDLGRLFGGIIGQTESNTRQLITLLEGLGRVCILVDEIEKQLPKAGATGAGDSGVGARLMGTLLTWMASKTCPVFLIGTLNNIDDLPPELIRRGRFDAVFFVDLPTDSERVAIFNALLTYKFKRQMVVKEADEMVKLSEGFSGAEIEGVIEDALYMLLEGGETSDDMLRINIENILEKTEPSSKQDPTYIKNMREKAKQFLAAGKKEVNAVDSVVSSGTRSVHLN